MIDLYINGVKENSAPSIMTNDLVNKIGGAWSATYSWSGLIDEISVYKKALSETEIKALYKAGK
jgi:hypothetical protein